ncbi:MAG: sigma-70 family RNA polymerase sigma factor [Odoribacteraceae bacterium]|jgi:RNA polymerase sigma-70 factor (ECF subfamily)|nr:sigma-70 family RNA polymerase sigma factor [Odoribacteraceae bacterium]
MESPETILAIFKQDRVRGIRLLYDAYYEILLLYAAGITADTGAAEDVVQECFISFWMRDNLLKLPGGLEGYLFRAVKYTALNQVRTAKRRRDLHAAVSLERPEAEASVADEEINDMTALFAAINRLPAERKKIFLMICVDSLSYKEVAGSLGISINTVKTQMTRAVKALRESLQGCLFSILLAWIARDKRDWLA